MFDLVDMNSGDIVLELVNSDSLRAYLCDLYPLSEFGNLASEDVRKLLEVNGFRVFEID